MIEMLIEHLQSGFFFWHPFEFQSQVALEVTDICDIKWQKRGWSFGVLGLATSSEGRRDAACYSFIELTHSSRFTPSFGIFSTLYEIMSIRKQSLYFFP